MTWRCRRNKIKELMYQYKEVVIVFLLLSLFNIDSINELFKFKDYPFLYDAIVEKSTIISLIFKSVIISMLFLLIKTFIE